MPFVPPRSMGDKGGPSCVERKLSGGVEGRCLSHAILGAMMMRFARRIQEIDELNAFMSLWHALAPLIPFLLLDTNTISVPSSLALSLAARRSSNEPSTASSLPRYVSQNPVTCQYALALCPVSSAYFQCQHLCPAQSSSGVQWIRENWNPLKRCKMSHSPGKRDHSRKRKSLFVELADADAILDQPPPNNSFKTLTSSNMGDATVNGDMPSSSFLSVSPPSRF